MQEQCQRIGEAAGKIYKALEKEGKSFEVLSKDAQVTNVALFNQAIGWLCREGKLSFEKKGTSVQVTLSASSGVCCS